MKIAMIYKNRPGFHLNSHEQMGLGGSESGFVRTVKHLVEQGHTVHVYNLFQQGRVKYSSQLEWSNLNMYDPAAPYDVVYSLRHREVFTLNHLDDPDKHVNAPLRVLFMADTESHGLGEDVRTGKINLVMFVSNWQKEKIQKEEGLPDEYCMITSNGVDAMPMPDLSKKIPGRCLFTATPERGLSTILDVWPEIRRLVPHATLHLYSSYIAWDNTPEDNDEMLKDIYQHASDLQSQGVVNWKHASSEAIRQAQIEADVYLYPTDFYETRCMSILEAMYCGVIPVATGRAAILEAVVQNVTGYIIPAYGAATDRYRKTFVWTAGLALARMKMYDGATNDWMRRNAMQYANRYTYDLLVPEWITEWQTRLKS